MRFIRRHKIVSGVLGAVVAIIVLAGVLGQPSTTGNASAAATTSSSPPPGTVGSSRTARGVLPATRVTSDQPAAGVATSTAPALVDGPSAANAALAVLATLAVKGKAAMTGFAPDMFGAPLTEATARGDNGCDTRDDILRRDLTHVVTAAGGCTVRSGTLRDPYTGATILFRATDPGTVQIDHVVTLADAWVTGIDNKPTQLRDQLAHDPLDLQATEGPVDAKKGTGDAAAWLPPAPSYRCTYVARQIDVKAKYRLWVTPAEHDAMVRVLAGCGGTPPSSRPLGTTRRAAATSVAVAPPSTTPSTTSPPVLPPTSGMEQPPATTDETRQSVSTAAAPQGCSPLTNAGNCYRPGEFCRASDHGVIGTDASGDRIQCLDNDGWRWEQI